MENWETLEPDLFKLVPSSNYTAGRGGNSIEGVILHHNAGNLTHDQVYNAFISNGTSAHYNVRNSSICQFVYDSNTAYHAGNWSTNQRTIGIEHCNDDTTEWTISNETLENGAHLVAAICRKFGLGTPEYGTNVRFHSDIKATACPGAIAGSQKSEYFERSKYWYEQMTGSGGEGSAVVCVWQCSANLTDAQLWRFEQVGEDIKIVNKTGTVLDVKGGTDAGDDFAGRDVQAYRDNATDAQRWQLVESEIDGAYHVCAKLGDYAYCLDVDGGTVAAREYVHLHTVQGELVNKWAQSWYVVPYWADSAWNVLVNTKSLYVLDSNPQNQ